MTTSVCLGQFDYAESSGSDSQTNLAMADDELSDLDKSGCYTNHNHQENNATNNNNKYIEVIPVHDDDNDYSPSR